MRFFLALLVASALYADDVNTSSISVFPHFENLPEIILHSVNVISGQYADCEKDMRVVSPVPLVVERSKYNGTEILFDSTYGWQFNMGEDISFEEYKKPESKKKYNVYYTKNHNEKLFFGNPKSKHNFRGTHHVDKSHFEEGSTNCSRGVISGQTNLKNLELTYNHDDPDKIEVVEGDGTKKTFKTGYKYSFYLKKELLPNGNYILYHPEKDTEICKLVCNANHEEIAWIRREDDDKQYIFKGSDGRQVIYKKSKALFQETKDKWDEKSYFSYVKRPDGPPVSYSLFTTYPKANLIKSRDYPDGRYANYSHFGLKKYISPDGKEEKIKDDDLAFRRVRQIRAPLECGNEPYTMYDFWYSKEKTPKHHQSAGKTIVKDAYGRRKTYHYVDNRITLIEHYLDDGKTLAYTENLKWGEGEEQGDLKLRSIVEPNGHILCEKLFFYDEKHNVKKETIWGVWVGIGGDSLQITTRTFTNSVHNLPVTETNEQGTTHYSYYHNTNLIRAKIFKGHDGILVRHYFEYDKNGVVCTEILDNGGGNDATDLRNVTERKIKRTKSNNQGLPVEVSEYYLENGQEKLLSKEINTYSTIGRLIKHDFYGSDNILAYSEEWDYDEMGNVTREKNGLGHEVIRSYDLNGNMTHKIGPSPSEEVFYSYDFMNRLIRMDEKLGDQTLSTHYKYDRCGNRIYEIDSMGRKTEYTYNSLGHRTRTLLSSGALITQEYDPLGRMTKEVDGEGNITTIAYTLLGLPYHISYPDGSEEKMIYDYSGHLVKKFEKNGVVVEFKRDSLGRILKTTHLDGNHILSQTSATYETFHPLTETDAAGKVTTFYYNSMGQKIKEVMEDKCVEYAYDCLGKLCQIKTGDLITIQKHDILDRLIEEKIETVSGEILSHKQKTYDESGRILTTLTLSERGYDLEEFSYNSKGQLVEAKNALGEITRHHYEYTTDGLKHLVVDPMGGRLLTCLDGLGRIIQYERQSSLGETLQKRLFTYDKNNNKIKAVETVYEGKNAVKEITTLWSYDKLNRVVSFTEGAYTPEQKKITTVYNVAGQKWKTIKPDGVVLEYSYDLLGRVKSINSSDQTVKMNFAYDVLNNVIQASNNDIQITREYDGKKMLSESYLGIKLKFTYDSFDRLLSITYPDQSSTYYTYKGGRIDSINRNGKITSYRYALNGKPITILHFDGSETTFEYDALGRETKISDPFHCETYSYDGVGNLIAKNNQVFAYDELNQIKSEDNHQYSHDSRYNCLSDNEDTYTYNALDQPNHLTYDRNGNLKSLNDCTFTYDALDRLTQVTKNDQLFTYSYDPFNRRLKNNETLYLYQGQNEIGSQSPSESSLRILGVGKGAENSAAILFELNYETYIPLHDNTGSVIQLRQGYEVQESHNYSSFGLSSTSSISPWRYSSKRLDPETNLYYFGRRFYDAKSHRWLTQDPKGYDGGPNLYAYVLNQPLSHIDLYGLEVATGIPWHPMPVLTTIASFPGMVLELIGQHLIPIPLIRDVVEYSGHVLQGKGLSTYTPSYSRNHSDTIYLAGDISKNVTVHHNNGICTSREEAMKLAIKLQNENGGVPVHFIYNGSKGFITDLIECSMQKLGIQTTPEKLFIEDINSTAKAYGPDHTFLVTAHSQGGLITGNSLPYLSKEIKSHMHVRTIGTASIISNDHGLASVQNYVSMGDIVYLTDPWGAAKGLMGKSNVTFMKPKSFMFPDHMLGGKTYQKAFEQIFKDFNDIIDGTL